jgi:antitoxin (DNA-binding transcriptional repressor) of toxin-antitoxin stability system
MPLYLYAVMRADDLGSSDVLAAVEHAPPIELIVHGDVAALVSPVEDQPVRLRREAVTAHTEVLQLAFEHGPVLPLRFGTVVPDAEALRSELLAPRGEEMKSHLDQLADKGEFRLKVSYREEPLLHSILAQDPALKRSAEQLRVVPEAASHFQRVGLGERITLAMQTRRDADAQQLLSELAPLAVAVEVGALQQPAMVLNASFLVAQEARDRFDAKVDRLASERAELMDFKLIGPLPAHSFVDKQLAAPGAPVPGPTS